MDAREVGRIRMLVGDIFGPPHPDVVFHGVFFHSRRYPFTFYPNPSNASEVAVCLPAHQSDDELAPFLHLCHELVHCLTPNGPSTGLATILEEGLAEHAKIYLGQQKFQRRFPDFDFTSITSGPYQAAFELVEHLIALTGLAEMRKRVRDMRRVTGKSFSALGNDDLRTWFPEAAPDFLSLLGAPFRSISR